MIQTFLSAFILFIPLIYWAYVLVGRQKSTVLFIAILSVLAYMLWRIQSPYPSALNWDMWEHQTIVNAIRNGNIAILPSALSDTFRFNGYTTLFHTLTSASQLVGYVNIPGYWWFADFFILLTGTLAAASLTYQLTKQSLSALFAAACSIFFFESSVVYATMFYMPQTVAGVLFALALATVISKQSVHTRILTALLTSLVLIPMHFIVGGAGALVLFAYIFIDHVKTMRTPAYTLALTVFPVTAYLAFSAIAQFFHLGDVNYGEAAAYTQTAVQKLSVMQSWYSYIPLLLVPLGIIESITDKRLRSVTLLGAVLAGITLSEFPYALKFYTLGRYMVVTVMAAGSLILFSVQRHDAVKNAIFILCLAVFGVIFYTNTYTWKQPLMFESRASYFSGDDISAVNWLKQQKNKTVTILMSDPATSAIYEPLTGINTPGGAYMNKENRKQLTAALTSVRPEILKTAVSRFTDGVTPDTHTRTLIVVTARTLEWRGLNYTDRMSVVTNIWKPNSFSINDYATMESFAHDNSLNVLYENPSVMIFESKESI